MKKKQVKRIVRKPLWGTPPVIAIPTETYRYLLSQDNAENLLMLYSFFVSCGCDEIEGEIHITQERTANSLNWSERKVRQTKKKLMNLGLLATRFVRDKKQKIKRQAIRLFYVEQCAKDDTTYGPGLARSYIYTNIYKYILFETVTKNRDIVSNSVCFGVDGDVDRKTEKTTHQKPSLFNAKKPTTKGQKFDSKMARQLARCVQLRRVQKGRMSLYQWTEEFRKLRTIDKVSAKVITKTIGWYCDHWKDNYVPVIYHAMDLRKKFGRVEQARKRHLDKTKDADREDSLCQVKERRLSNGVIRRAFHYSDDED